MNDAIKTTILQALHNFCGDDLQRAQNAFRNCTAEQMQMQYGQSGKTRAAILSGYQAHQNRVNDSIAYIKDSL